MDKEVIKYRIREAWIAFSDAKFSTPIDNVTNRLISEFVFQMIDRLMEFTGTDVFLKKAEELHEYAMLRKEELALAIRPRDVERFQQYIDYLKKSDFERYNEPKFEHGLPFILTVEEIKRLNDNMKRQVEDPAETEARHQKIRALSDIYDELYDGGVPAPRFPSSSRHVGYESKAEAIKSGFLSRLEFFPSNPRSAHFPPVNSAVSKTAESHSSSAKLNPPLFRPANMISSATSAPSGSGFGSMGNKDKEKIQSSSKEASPIPVDETWEKTSTDNFSSASVREKLTEERALDRPSRTMDNIEIPRDFRGRSVDSNAERGLVNSMAGLHISRDSRGKSVDRSSQLSRSGVMDKIRKICEEVEKKAVELEKLRAGQTVDTLKDSYHHSRGKMIDLKGQEVQKTKENIASKAQSSDGKFLMAESVQDIGRHQEALADIRKQYEEYLKTLGKKKEQRTKDNIKISQNSTENLGEVQAQNKRRPVRVIRHNYSERREKSEDSYGQLSRRAMDKMDSKYQSSGKRSVLDESMYEGPTLQAMRKRYAAELESSESEEEREKVGTKDNIGSSHKECTSMESLLKAGEGRERSRRRSVRVIRQNYEDSTQKLRQQGSQNVKNNTTSDRKIQQRSQSAYEVRCNKAAEWVDKSSAFFDSTVGNKSNIPKELNEYDLSEWDTLNSVENSFNNEKKRFEGWVKEESGEKKAEKKEEKNVEIQVQKPGLKVDEKVEKIAENCMGDAKTPCQKETPITSTIVVVHRPGGLDVITNNPKYTKTHIVVCEDILKFNYKPFFTSGLTNSFGQSWNSFEKPQPIVVKNVEWDLRNSVRKNEKRILPNPGITEAKKSDVISPKSPAESLVTVSTINMQSNAPSPQVRQQNTFSYAQDPEFVYAQWTRILILCGDDWPSVRIKKSLHPSTFIHRLTDNSTLKQLVELLRKFEYSEKVKSVGITANNHWTRQAPGSWGLIGDVFRVIQELFPMARFTMTTCFNTYEFTEPAFNRLLNKKLAHSRTTTLIDVIKEISRGNLRLKRHHLDDDSAQQLYNFMLDV